MDIAAPAQSDAAPAVRHASVPAASPSPRAPARRQATRRRRWMWVSAVVVLIAVVAGLWLHHRRAAAEAIAAASTDEIVTVATGDVTKSISSSGSVVANLEVDIKCRASGEVIKLPFDISQSVKKGDLLCQLDTTDEALAIRSAAAIVAQSTAKLAQAQENLKTAELNLDTTKEKDQATLASAKVKAANLQAKADRQSELVKQKLGSPEDYETAQTDAAAALADQRAAEIAIEEEKQQEIQLEFKRQDVASAAAQLQEDQIALDTQKQQLAYTTVTSPIDGVVSALDVQKGTIIASGTNGFSGGTTIMTLSDLSHIFVTATVDESDIGGVRVGQKAVITADSYPDRTFAGHVVRVAVKGASSSNVVTFEVKVEVDDPDKGLLKPEMTCDVEVIEANRNGVLTVPIGAVQHRRDRTMVQMKDGQMRDVKLGLEGADDVQILSGLSTGDQIRDPETDLPSKWKNENDGPPPR